VRPDQWLSSWSEPDPDEAIAEVCRRYLSAHGPATREEFARWWGFFPPQASKVLTALGEEVALVDREGDRAFVLRKDLTMKATEDDRVRTLGMFDPYTLSGLPHDQVVPKKHKASVLRPGAWVSQVILRGGRVVGVWTHERAGTSTSVNASLFEPKAVGKKELESALAVLTPYIGEIGRLTIGRLN
jgi:hypothetical protein